SVSDVDVAVDDLDRKNGNRLVGREGQGAAGREFELRTVCPALESVVLDESLREGDVAVGARVAQGVNGARGVHDDGDGRAVEHDLLGGRNRQVVKGADARAHAARSNSATSAAMRRSCSVSSGIRCTISTRKPSTTR